MLTERFHNIRKRELELIFTTENIAKVWRNTVKTQLRNIEVKDIFDYYDFNYNITDRASILRTLILSGNYQPKQPLIYKVEKKYGICRHLVIPQPLDALVLQIITKKISDEILENKPSENAFYSRDKHNISKPHEIDEYGFNWRELWQKMQKKIYNFSEYKKLIVVTDLANYYDSIFIPELRNIINSYIKNNESLLDILFKILEKLTWVPDYLPYNGRGLPTTNLEGVRLLAHAFLFEIDTVLKNKSNDCFVRWMDDIVIGVNSRKEAIDILSSTSDMLKSRGLAFNIKKTDIYSAEEAEYHFMINENQYIDSIDISYYLENGINHISNELFARFNNHLKNNRTAKYSEKITKRYITTFGKLKSKRLLTRLPVLFSELPSVRPNLLFYLSNIGYSKRTADIVLKILDELKLHDDISLLHICKLITDWQIPLTNESYDFLRKFYNKVKSFSIERQKPFDFYCILWIKSKYDNPDELIDFIFRYEYIWKSHIFLQRQVTSIMGRLLNVQKDLITRFLYSQIAASEPQVVSVANSILSFSSIDKIENKVVMYLFPTDQKRNYPLHKFVVLCSFLNSQIYSTNEDIHKKIIDTISDPYYLKWLGSQYNIK